MIFLDLKIEGPMLTDQDIERVAQVIKQLKIEG